MAYEAAEAIALKGDNGGVRRRRSHEQQQEEVSKEKQQLRWRWKSIALWIVRKVHAASDTSGTTK